MPKQKSTAEVGTVKDKAGITYVYVDDYDLTSEGARELAKLLVAGADEADAANAAQRALVQPS